MAACGGIEHIFEQPLPDSPALLESLSPWKQIQSVKTVDHSSFTELFGEFFKENNNHVHVDHSPESSSPFSSPSSSLSSNSIFSTNPNAPLSPIDALNKDENGNSNIHEDKTGSPKSSYRQRKQYRHSDSFSSMNSESLSICTEGLGFESFDDVEDLLRNDILCNNDNWQADHEERTTSSFREKTENITENHWGDLSKRSRLTRTATFPPPISSIGRSGKPCVSFKSFRQDGRFILKEIRIPTQELLHACRENGRLKLQFIQSDDEILEEEENKEIFEENNEDKGEGQE